MLMQFFFGSVKETKKNTVIIFRLLTALLALVTWEMTIAKNGCCVTINSLDTNFKMTQITVTIHENQKEIARHYKRCQKRACIEDNTECK